MELKKKRPTRIPIPELTLLDLDDDPLGLVARKLSAPADLAALRLTHRRLEAAVAVRITRLHRLDSRPDKVYEIQRLAVKFPHLTSWHAPWHRPCHSEQLRELFAGLCSLKELEKFKFTRGEDRELLSNLSKLPEILDLSISSSGPDADGLRPLSSLNQLTSLALQSDWAGSDASSCLKVLIDLEELSLVWTRCQGSPLQAFPTSLTKREPFIDFVSDDECLDDEGIGAGLTQLAHLQDLSLGSLAHDYCLVGSSLTALSRLTQLSSLTLNCIYDWTHGALAVLKDCFALRSLTILSAAIVTAQGLFDMSHTPGLKALKLKEVEAPDMLDLFRLITLTSLYLDWYDSESMQVYLTQFNSTEFLSTVPGLQTFRMHGCIQVSSSALWSLRHLSQLTRLELRSCDGVSPDFLVQLKMITCLTRLHLSENSWVQAQYASVLTALTALEELELCKCSELSEEMLQYLHVMSKSRKLSLSGNEWLGRDGLRFGLTGLESLEALELDHCQNVTEADLLYACDRLRLLQLNVRFLDLTDAAGRRKLQGPVGVCVVRA